MENALCADRSKEIIQNRINTATERGLNIRGTYSAVEETTENAPYVARLKSDTTMIPMATSIATTT
jgi:hypothetical protein